MTAPVTTRARHRTDDAEGISAAELLARYSDAGFDRPSRTGRRSAERSHESLRPYESYEQPTDRDATVVTQDAPAGLDRGDAVPPAGLIRGRTSETGSFGRNPRAVAATMGATLVGATAVMGVVTAFDSPADTATDLQTRPVDLAANADQATMKLNAVGSQGQGHSATGTAFTQDLNQATGMMPSVFDQANAAQIAANNLAAAKKAQDAQKAAANQQKAGDDSPLGGLSLSGSSAGMQALQAAMGKIGKPYVWGATGPNAFDCSGLMQWAFEKAGLDLPRTSSAQSQIGEAVSKDELKPGDLVFFYSPVSHVGIYAGNGKVLNAVGDGKPVSMSDLDDMPFHNARRV